MPTFDRISPSSFSPNPLLDRFFDDSFGSRFAGGGGGGGGLWDYSNTVGPVIETPRTSTNGESRGVIHRHEAESYQSNSLSERLLNLRLDDGHSGGGCSGGENRNGPDAEPRAVAGGAGTGNQPIVRPAVPLIVADNTTRIQDIDLQDDPQELSLPRDPQISQHKSSIRKSDDGLFVIPGIPQKPQHLRGKGQEQAARTGTRRRHSVDNVLDGETFDANDKPGLPLLRHSKSWREDTTPKTTQLLACPYLKYAPGKNSYRCRAAAYPSIHRLK